MNRYSSEDTIAAISTAMSPSGIGIVRISGPEALLVGERVFCPASPEKKVTALPSGTFHYGHIADGEEQIDEVLLLIMKKPHSYTGEDTVEIDCHGGVLVMERILQTVCKHGARLAEPGEFSRRAFLNGRIDLSQAEAVMDLISAKNELARKNSLNQLSGRLSSLIKALREKILYETAFIESALDDPEHYSLENYPDHLSVVIRSLRERIRTAADSFDRGKIIHEGIDTVILGKPNVGKSSLLNVLLGEERAIVTEIAGTTRDTLKEHMMLSGISLNLIDTAGVRETDNVVEKIGVDRSIKSADNADLILFLVDSSREFDGEDRYILQMVEDKKVIVILSKSDLPSVTGEAFLREITPFPIIPVSAKDQTGIDLLEEKIREMFLGGEVIHNDELLITSLRHKEALLRADKSLSLVEESLDGGMPEDFYTIDLMNAYESLGEIIGEALGEDLVNEIFSRFCMGK